MKVWFHVKCKNHLQNVLFCYIFAIFSDSKGGDFFMFHINCPQSYVYQLFVICNLVGICSYMFEGSEFSGFSPAMKIQ